MICALRWDNDGEALLCDAGPWTFVVAYIEVYDAPESARGTALLMLYRWERWGRRDGFGYAMLPGDADDCAERRRLNIEPHEDTAQIMCQSADEARAVLVALLRVRGVDAPAWVAPAPTGS